MGKFALLRGPRVLAGVLNLPLAFPPSKRANASSNEGRSTREPNVGVPHRELATPISNGSDASRRIEATPASGPCALSSSSTVIEVLIMPGIFLVGTAMMCPKSDPGALVTRITFQPVDAASETISRSVRSCALNVTCICNTQV